MLAPDPVLSRLLLLPLLAPLLAVLLVAAINPRPTTSLRLLIWSLPALPLGAWIGLAGAGGAALSAGFTALALKQGAIPAPANPRQEPAQAQRRSSRRNDEDPGRQKPERASRSQPFTPPAWSGPERAPQDPLPTVSVPFRVIRRGPATVAGPVEQARATAMTPEEGWDAPLAEDW
ncbi:hypothetical protein FB106_11575 [Synechococcus sp. Ace-Pa]|nr:hypothetical protein FB106_11575 [Synechococcus sp. Ace-Pa]